MAEARLERLPWSGTVLRQPPKADFSEVRTNIGARCDLLRQSWFEKLTGFAEEAPDQVRDKLVVEGEKITSMANGRQMTFGRLETPTLAELREQLGDSPSGTPVLSVEEVVDDVQTLHLQARAAGALFQVASQFNLLEMASPSVTPEAGVSIYASDRTQGPACAIAAGAGTIYRNYLAPVGGRIGQSESRQIDCLDMVGEALGNETNKYWSMRNGYALASEEGLRAINARLAGMDDGELDDIRGRLKIGVQWDTEVTIDDCGHRVTQAFCSALPVAYSPHLPELWEPFARLVLEAAYEATLAVSVLNRANTGNRTAYLTLVGGGVFGNRCSWILSAVRRALGRFENFPLDVKIVSHGSPNPRLKELT